MMIDVVCVVVLVIFGVLGAWRGFVRQVFGLLGIVCIALFALPLGVKLAGLIAEGRAWGPAVVTNLKVGLALGAALGIYVVSKLVCFAVNRTVGAKRSDNEEGGPAPWNRYWGAALGIVKAGILCWLVLCFFAAFPETAPGVAARAEQSGAARTTGLFNPFERWIGSEKRTRMREALVALWKLKRQPSAWKEVIKEASVQRVLKHERLAQLLDEGEGRLLDALAAEDFRKSLSEIDWSNVIDVANRALKEADEEE